MRFSAKLGLAAATALTLCAPAARAQSRIVELGADAAIGFGLEDPKTTSINIPTGRFRAGWYTRSEKWSIEPSAQFNYTSTDAFNQTYFAADVGFLYHTSTIRSTSQLFFRPFIGMQTIGFKDKTPPTSSTSASQLGMGVGVGMKWPLITNRLSTRGEIQLAHYFDTDKLAAQTNINLLFGLSFFTR